MSFRPRIMSATHNPSNTERLMNPYYHSELRLPPYRSRYMYRFHPYPHYERSVNEVSYEDGAIFFDTDAPMLPVQIASLLHHGATNEMVAPTENGGQQPTNDATIEPEVAVLDTRNPPEPAELAGDGGQQPTDQVTVESTGRPEEPFPPAVAHTGLARADLAN